MAYGRLSVARDELSRRSAAGLVSPRRNAALTAASAAHGGRVPLSVAEGVSRADRIGSAKKRRWYLETVIGPRTAARKAVTRNAILNIPVAALADTDRRRTDILHEYFVPPERFADFLAACRDVIPPSGQDLLNITLRWLEPDTTSVLSFAPAPRIAAVMLFPQQMTAEGEEQMRAMTEALIDRVLALGGSYYLPYRLHARRDQLSKAYPRIEEFFAKKRSYDPQLRFQEYDVGEVLRRAVSATRPRRFLFA